MSNILFSKKFLTKLTAIIRNFWWTGVKDESTTKSLCLRAWADICIEKKIGGLGVRNLQALNKGLLLSAAWRLAKEPQSQLALILRAKYHHDTSIWRAKPNKPKSAFWAAILKVQPLLISAAFYQIFDGNISIWSSPWFSDWERIYDNLNIQPPPFVYPAVVKDLWIPNQKAWNADLIRSLFTPHTANAILQTPIINSNGKDTLVWKLTPAGDCTSKSAYKHCFNNLALPVNQQPKVVSPQIISLLNHVWQDTSMAPRVQTFAWRLLRKALSTGKRASRFSKHIQPECSRCGCVEDEMHLLFLCPFSKAAWYCHPWYIRIETLAAMHHNVPALIQALLLSGHPQINQTSLYTFLWCLWKARNDCLFNKKRPSPANVFAVSNAIMQEAQLEVTGCSENQHNAQQSYHLTPMVQIPSSFAGEAIFCDAAWKLEQDAYSAPAGIGIFIQMEHNQHCKQMYISAMSPPASSPLQAETFGLLLATKLADLLQLQAPRFFTDNSILTSAATTTNIVQAPGHWMIRPLIADIQSSNSFQAKRISHLHRSFNVKAHHQARLATRLHNRTLTFRCLCSNKGKCPYRDIFAVASMDPFMLLSVKCA
jgi:hypothetical protein